MRRKRRYSFESLERRELLTGNDVLPFAYAWVNNAPTEGYNPDARYARNPTGGDVTAWRLTNTPTSILGTGKYGVRFDNLFAAGSGGGNVQVTAYGSTSNYCNVELWGSDSLFIVNPGSHFYAQIGCYDASGIPSNSAFNVAVIHENSVVASRPSSAANEGDIAFAYAGSPTTTSYTATSSFAHNPNGSVQINRQSTGSYSVNFRGLGGGRAGGTVQVTGYGTGNARCISAGWSSNLDFVANVNCFAPNGQRIDSPFSIAVIPPVNNSSLAYAWADRSTSNSYSPNSTYTRNPEGADINITRQSLGRYAVDFADLNPARKAGGHVQVTAYGGSGNHCKVQSWNNPSTNFTANVACFDSVGAPTDSQFNILAAPSPEGDRFEPNDTSAFATELGTGQQSLEDLSVLGCGTDIANCSVPDFYRWRGEFIGGTGEVQVTAQFRNADGNLDLVVVDGSGRTFRSASNSDNETVSLRVNSGEAIAIKIEGRNGATNDDYALAIVPDDHGNDAATASPPLRDPREETYFVGQIQSSTDRDWFRFEAMRGQELSFESFWLPLPSLTSADLVTVNLYDRNGATLLGSSSATASLNYQRGPGWDWVVPLNGVYYLEVTSDSPYEYSVRVDGIEQVHDSGIEVNVSALETPGVFFPLENVVETSAGVPANLEFALNVTSPTTLANPRYTFSSAHHLVRLQFKDPVFGVWRDVAISPSAQVDGFTTTLEGVPRTKAGYHLRAFFNENPSALQVGACDGFLDTMGFFVGVGADGVADEVLSNPIVFRKGCPLEEALSQHMNVTLFDLHFPGARDADVIIEDRNRPVRTDFMPPTSQVRVELDEPFGGIIRIAVEAVGDAALTSSRWLTAAPISADLRRLSSSFTHMLLFDARAAAQESFGEETVDEFTFRLGTSGTPRIASFGIALVEEDTVPPTGNASSSTITEPQTQHLFNVTYRDASGIDLSSLGNDNLRIAGPIATSLNASFVEIVSASAGTVTAQYSVIGPGGSWDAGDPQGAYSLVSQPNQVSDAAGNKMRSAVIGTFIVDISPEVCGAGRLRGDVNGDGTVNFRDFLIVGANFGNSTGQSYDSGDLDCDGAVLFSDFLILAATFGSTA